MQRLECRLAPLSQGRVVQGKLQCSYHGWEFDKAGTCTNIPQLADGPTKVRVVSQCEIHTAMYSVELCYCRWHLVGSGLVGSDHFCPVSGGDM